MKRPIATLLAGFVGIAALLLAAALVYTLCQPVPAAPPLPKPNGYSLLVQAAHSLADNTYQFSTMSEKQLRDLVRTNSEALKVASMGLTQACQVPLEYSKADENLLQNLGPLKRLAQALMAQGRLAEMENRPADAAEAYLAAIRLGNAARRGGLVIYALVGDAIEAMGNSSLEKVIPGLDAKRCRKAAAVLEACDAQRESMDRIWARDWAWGRQIYGLTHQFTHLVRLSYWRQMERKTVSKQQTLEKRTRALTVQLAARAYELEKGERPKALADLVPT
jgi:hypothetical protein